MFPQPGAIEPPVRLHSEERIPAKEALTSAFAEPLGLQGTVKAQRTSFSSNVYSGNEIVVHGDVVGRPAHLQASPLLSGDNNCELAVISYGKRDILPAQLSRLHES